MPHVLTLITHYTENSFGTYGLVDDTAWLSRCRIDGRSTAMQNQGYISHTIKWSSDLTITVHM